MSLTDLQKASFRQHIHNASQIKDDSGNDAITAGGGQDAIDAAIAAHDAATDPHPTYLTQAEADALYAASGSGFSNPMTSAGDIIYEGGGTDVARSGTASAPSGTAGGSGTPDVTIDGNDGTYWASGAEAVANIILNIDLGSAKAVASWRVLHAFSLFGPNTLLESSPDSTTWTQRDSYATSAGADSGLRSISAVTARYWRLRNPTNSNNRFGIFTFSLFDAVVPARLAKGTSGQVLTQGSTAPAWATPRGMCLGAAGYRPVTDTTVLTTTNTTGLDDIDASLAVTFTPLGTKALARVTLMQEDASTGGNSYVGVKNGSTVVGKNLITVNAGHNYIAVSVALLVTGLTPGTPLTWKPGVGVSDAGHGMLVLAGPTFGQVVMEVWDVP